MKRFQLEAGDKTQYFLEEGADMRFVAISYRQGSKLEVTFGGQNAQRPQEIIDVDEFIGLKSHRAKGKRITTYEVDTLRFIEPEEEEEDELIADIDAEEDVDVEGLEDGDIALDMEDILGEEIKADPNVDYSSRGEGDDVGFSASQLDLFN